MLEQDKNFPFISIITVTYNSSKYVREAIESVLASSFKNFELIIGDDCSSDNTWDIVQEYNDARIVKYKNSTNLGEYPNRDKALRIAKGEWVLYIDGDDLVYPHALELISSMISKYPSVGMLLMRWYRKEMLLPVVISPRDFYVEYYFGEGFLGTAFTNVVFSKKALLDNGGIPHQYSFGDDVVRLNLATKYNMMIIPDQLTFWRETPNQAFQIKKNLLSSYLERNKFELMFLKQAKEASVITTDEFLLEKYNWSRQILKDIVKHSIKFRFNNAIQIWNNFKQDLVWTKQDVTIKLPFEEYSPSNLLTFEKSVLRLQKLMKLE